MSSTSSQDQSPFHERKLTNPFAAPPPSNYPLYQMDSTNQPPRSSGPPRTNVKGIYENSQSSIPVSTYVPDYTIILQMKY